MYAPINKRNKELNLSEDYQNSQYTNSPQAQPYYVRHSNGGTAIAAQPAGDSWV